MTEAAESRQARATVLRAIGPWSRIARNTSAAESRDRRDSGAGRSQRRVVVSSRTGIR